jgi:hypothetical protein
MGINTNLINLIRTFVTGSRRGDLLVFTLLTCLVIATGYRLRAYFQVTVVDVSVVRVSPDGTRQTLPTPEQFRRTGLAAKPSAAISKLERRIEKYMKNYPRLLQDKPVDRYEWIIRYSFNTTLLDREHVIVFRNNDLE